jgi:hypothetical protein
MNKLENEINKKNIFKNIYGENKGIIELTLNDFIKKKCAKTRNYY